MQDPIDLGKRKGGSISDLLDGYMKRFKIVPPDSTLFPPDFTLLKETRCPVSRHKLKMLKNGKIWICGSKKCKFIITSQKLKTLTPNNPSVRIRGNEVENDIKLKVS